jgi:hypothetical protein
MRWVLKNDALSAMHQRIISWKRSRSL